MLRNKFLLAIACMALSTPALAADPHRLAFSDRLGVEVFALPGKSGDWCGSELTLSLALKAGSPLIEKGIERFVPKLGPVFNQECPSASKANVQAYAAATRAPIGSIYTALKSHNWSLEKASAVQAAAPTLTPPPPSQIPKLTAKPSKPLSTQAEIISKWGLLLAYSEVDDQILNNEKTVYAYAAEHDCKTLAKNIQNEFKLQEYLGQTRSKLVTQASTRKPYMRMKLDVEFGQYNEQYGAFDFEPLSDSTYYGAPSEYCYGAGRHTAPLDRFTVAWKTGKTIFRLPMPKAKAEALINQINRERYGRRKVRLELITKPYFAPATSEGVVRVEFDILEATVYASAKNAKRLHVYSDAELVMAGKALEVARIEAAEAKRKAEAEGKRQAALKRDRQRADRDFKRLQYAPLSNKIAYLNGVEKLDTVNLVIGQSLVAKSPYPATFLVQAGKDGRTNIGVAWPSRLTLHLTDGIPDMEQGKWYVVSGIMTARQQADNAPPTGSIDVAIATACEQDMCTEANDLTKLIHKRYPSVDWQSAQK